ncbi:unnamed protein product [Parascedosporium putredinis]|uniref:T6SS Phospholipase effector Tle1-like catalytic domain-containing protein n=1 Tax=Parascedosporium putredinis TaxID=1442378 RepID=A0A9P1H9H7_9PEZI|nr:unnamed protein product [Parascedosporium putredinis]CAI8001757.1 unnamed protein product [Parascedosporium putredinis]
MDITVYEAARKGDVQSLKHLFTGDSAVDVNQRDGNGLSALIHAVRNHKSEAIRFLLQQPGVDVDLADTKGQTPYVELGAGVLLELQSFNHRRRIIICCDGTWNDREAEQPFTNVTRILDCIDTAGFGDHPMQRFEQLVYYMDGIGTGTTWVGARVDGAFGTSIARKICEAYRVLCSLYVMSADQIVLIGFSRGAFTALCLANFVNDVGLLQPDSMNEELPKLFQLWYTGKHKVTPETPRETTELETLCTDLAKQGRLRKSIKINALALWDTVKSLVTLQGWIPFSKKPTDTPFHFINDQVPQCVHRAYQALALQEARKDFQPLVLTSSNEDQLKQCWFLGSHCDIGGGDGNNGLANIALCWMIAQLQGSIEFKQVATWDSTGGGRVLDGATILEGDARNDTGDSAELTPSWTTTISGYLSYNSLTWFWVPRGSVVRRIGGRRTVTGTTTIDSYERIHFSVQALIALQSQQWKLSVPSLDPFEFCQAPSPNPPVIHEAMRRQFWKRKVGEPGVEIEEDTVKYWEQAMLERWLDRDLAHLEEMGRAFARHHPTAHVEPGQNPWSVLMFERHLIHGENTEQH